MERHIYSIAYEHLAEQELLSDAQLGFSPGKSTVTALVSLSFGKMVLICNLCLLTYLKLSIVSIPKAKILDNQHILQWIASYLCNRQLVYAHLHMLGHMPTRQPTLPFADVWA